MLYRWLKAKTSRPRPYRVNRAITCNARPLDQFSFPSGHTLHAVAFTAIAIAYYPQLAVLFIPFAFLVRGGRTDVLDGEWHPERLVVLEFDIVEKARVWWGSTQYAAAKKMRQRTAISSVITAEGSMTWSRQVPGLPPQVGLETLASRRSLED
jgi:uncharacterized protein (DUF1330 family)